MGPVGSILLVVLCTMLQVPPADPAKTVARSHHHHPHHQPNHPIDHPPIARQLSRLCCGAGQQLDVAAAACRPRQPGPPHSLGPRSRLTELPPNCPPPTKYDPEAKVCRDMWRK